MFRTTLLRPLTRPLTRLPLRAASSHPFSTTPRRLISPGEPLPDTDALMEDTPGQRVNLADEAEKVNNMLLIGVPAAFSPSCSAKHVPGYLNHPRAAEFDMIGVVSVNDVFVMKAWGEALDPVGDETGPWEDSGSRRPKVCYACSSFLAGGRLLTRWGCVVPLLCRPDWQVHQVARHVV